MTRQHGTMHNRFRVEAAIDGQHSHAVLIPPQQPTRRRSPDLSAYDRLDPPKPRRYGKGRMAEVEGMDRLRAALDEMAAKVNAAAAEAARFTAEDAMRKAGYHSGGTVKIDPVPPAGLHRGETVMGVDLSASPDRTGMGFRWPDGSIRPFSHKRSADYW